MLPSWRGVADGGWCQTPRLRAAIVLPSTMRWFRPIEVMTSRLSLGSDRLVTAVPGASRVGYGDRVSVRRPWSSFVHRGAT